MVVDPNTLVNTIIPVPPAACPAAVTAVLPPAAMTPAYIQSHNPINPVSSIQYTQGCPIPIQTGQILTAVPVSSMVPGSPTINSSTSGASPVDNYTLSIYPNGFFSQNIYPYAYVPLKNGIQSQLLSSVPSTFLSCDPKLVPNSQTASTSSSLVQCNPGSTYKYATISTPSLVPCTSRMVNGAPVYPMHLTPIVPTASLEMHPIPTPQIINNMDMFRVTPPPPLPPATSTWKQSYGMELVWQNEFKCLFDNYEPNVWVLLPISQKPQGHWNTYVDSAKVRFCCEDCGHGWTSMKGRVAFWFVLDATTGKGMVCLKLYGQQCDRCPTRNYESAMWYPEEVRKVMTNIYNKVGEVYYGFQVPPYFNNRRAGKPRTPHNTELCQACKDGVCSERR